MFFTDTHEWITIDNDVGTVGITSYAQKELGEIVYVELPKLGSQIKAGEEVAVLESTKAAADIYCPVSGDIIMINEKVKEDPSLLHSSSENQGWLFKIRLTHPQEVESLLDRHHYQQLIGI